MAENKRNLDIEIVPVSNEYQLVCDEETLVVILENKGDNNPIYGWNQKAVKGNIVETSQAFGLGWPHVMKNRVLNIDFERVEGAGEINLCIVTIYRDKGPIC